VAERIAGIIARIMGFLKTGLALCWTEFPLSSLNATANPHTLSAALRTDP